MSQTPRKFFIIGIVFLVVVGMGAPTALAALADDLNVGTVDETNTAPNPYIDDDGLTKAEHPMDEGASDTAMEGYFDDNGDWVSPAESHITVNTSSDVESGDNVNPYSFSPGHIQDSSYTTFPDKSDRTWTNASRWSTGGTNSTKLSAAANTTVASDVDGVRFNTGGGDMTAGDTAHWNFSAWDGELDSDESKRVLQIAMDVDTLEAGTNVTVRVYDESDDYKEVRVDDGADVTGVVFANSTGDSKVYQIKLSKLTTNGGGSWDNIEKVSIIVDDGDADVSVSWLDLRKKGKNTLGEKMATTNDDGDDPDSDGDYDEVQTIYNSTGDISVHSMETLDSEYDNAIINDVTFRAHYPASKLQTEGDENDYTFSFEDRSDDFPGWEAVLNVSYRMEAPSAIDLSYGTTDLKMTQKWPEERYVVLETATDVSDSTNLTDVSDSSRTSKLSNLGSKSDELTLDSSVATGTGHLYHAEIKLTEDDLANLKDVSEGDGAAAPPAEEGGIIQSITNFVTNPIGAIITLAVGILSFRWWRRR